jgi:hypothetical protein
VALRVGVVSSLGCAEAVMSIFEQMRKEWREANGDELAVVVYWVWVWGSWVGLALFVLLVLFSMF